MKQCDLTKGLVVFLTIMITLFCGVMPSSWADGSPSCDLNDFQGCFGFTETGSILMGGTSPPVPMANVGWVNLQFYKKSNPVAGSITGSETANLGGCSFKATIDGEFEMFDSCTGTATVTVTPDYTTVFCPIPPLPVEATFSFVLTGDGKQAEIHMLTTQMIPLTPSQVEPPVFVPLAITGIAKKQGCDDDDDQQ